MHALGRLGPCLALLLLGCPSGASPDGDGPAPPPAPPPAEPGPRGTAAAPIQEGPPFTLREGPAPEQPWVPVPLAEAKPLGQAETQALLDRLPAQPTAETAEFAKRQGPPPPERTGETIAEPFPPPPAPPPAVTAPQGALTVARFQPEGDVPLVPRLSITFSQPMVPVGSLADLAQEHGPVRLSPQPAGRWRWIGTRTLVFEPDGERFPMATEYRVEVPAGTASQGGGRLAEAAAWTFRTPPPRVVRSLPTGGPTVREPTFVVGFDQRVDPGAVLEAIRVEAAGARVALRLATAEEANGLGRPGRSVVFRAQEPLPPNAAVSVKVGPGVPSAEGPRRSAEPATYAFRTYGPLKITGHRSGWGSDCPPGAPFQVTFSNPLDGEAFSDEQFSADPEIPGLNAWVNGNTLILRGLTRANTRYRITFRAGIRDAFGQTLGADRALDFRTTDPEPRLYGVGGDVIVLDPDGKPRTTVRSIAVDELRVRIYAVDPAKDWRAYQVWRGRLHDRNRRAEPPGRVVYDEEVEPDGSDDEWIETAIDLAPALKGGLGHAVVYVEPVDWPERRWRPTVASWVQATQLGLDLQADPTELLAWVTRLKDGAPVGGAEVSLLHETGRALATATSDPAGVARLELKRRGRVVIARQGEDAVLMPGHWERQNRFVEDRWFTFDDRHLYRPKEEVRVKGWVRWYDPSEGGDIAAHGRLNRMPRGYTVVDAYGNEIAKGQVTFDDLGGFDVRFTLPDTSHVGDATVRFEGGHAHRFKIAEFRRPEFEVTARPATAGPHFAGSEVAVTETARYFAGGVLPGARTDWKVEARPGHYAPPNRPGFAFGEYVPWWAREDGGFGDVRWGRQRPSPALHTARLRGRTDARGEHHVVLDLGATLTPLTLTAEASVQDVNRQSWSGSAALLVHPADVYVGVRLAKPYVAQGKPLALDAIAVDLDGGAVAGRPVEVTFARVRWVWRKGSFVEEVADEVVRKLESTEQPERVELKQPKGGLWRITALVTDAQGRRSQTTTQTWVAGGKGPSSSKVDEERVTLIPDQEEYEDGDTAEVLVVAPFSPAEGLMTLRRSGVIETVRFRMEGPTHVLKVPIADGLVPGVTVHVALVGAAARSDAPAKTRPAYAVGSQLLKVPPRRRTLALEVTPARSELEPGAETAVDLVVRDFRGEPVAGAEVAVAVVDEAILSLAGHARPDPLGVFYAPRPIDVRDARVRSYLRLQAAPKPEDQARAEEVLEEEALAAEPEMAMADGAPPGAMLRAAGPGGGGGAPKQPPIALRTDLRPLAVFTPAVRTDAQGRARIDYTLPDSLTRYRVVAVAAAGANSFGSREATLTARLPLMVRPSLPRFLNFGDACELPVVIQNQTDGPLDIQVAARAANLAFTAGQGLSLRVPAHDRREVRFPAAARLAGTARFQVAASAGEFVDAQQVDLPVWTPATSEAFATYGVLDEGALAQPIAPPEDAWPQYGGLEITTSSTGLQALTDAVIYLVRYPYECAEQVSSRLIALVAVRDVLAAFEADGVPSPAALAEFVAGDLQRLRQMQNGDGGWGFWRSGERSWPYLSIHVTHALARAKEKGYAVDDGALRRAIGYLKRIEQHIPPSYSQESRWALIAYALDVRARLGDRDVIRARRLLAEAGVDRLPLEAHGWIYPLLRRGDRAAQADAARIRRHLANRVVETAGAAHFATSYSDGAHVLLHSARRADGIILAALLDDPAEVKGDLAPKLVEGLLAHRRRGRWTNTQENAFVLLAFDRYFRTAEAVTPDFVARAWLGDAFAGEHAFRGRTTERSRTDVPMAWLQEAGDAPLILAKDGPGRLYYRIGLRYAPRDLRLEPLDAGFAVERRYEPVDDPGDVRRGDDGSWRIRAGARVRVRVSMVAPTRRYHVALVDPLPAGLEPLDPAFAATGSLPEDPTAPKRGRWWWWSRTWYEHSGLRDERAEAFTSLLWEGVHEFTYVTRATTPGTFVAPPAKAEEMYAPETFGRSGTDRVIVE